MDDSHLQDVINAGESSDKIMEISEHNRRLLQVEVPLTSLIITQDIKSKVEVHIVQVQLILYRPVCLEELWV